jgi:integrase
MTPSQRARKPVRRRQRPAGERYNKDSYRRAIARAVGLANKAREKAGVEERLPNWSPNQLRHLRAGEVKERFGIEEASAVLGHANIRTTEIYADRKLKIAAEVARQIG